MSASSSISQPGSGFQRRSGQKAFERFVREHRISGLLARRQYGKTTIASRIALRKMMKEAGHTVIFGSVKLDLAREIVRKEADALQKAWQMFAAALPETQRLELNDIANGKPLIGLSADDFAELYEATRLEFRLYHSNSVYSRTKVVALSADAVGETGDLIMDEVGRVKNFLAVLEAVLPIIGSNPSFRCIFTTTPPPDDSHPSFDLLAPPIGLEMPVNPEGNTYVSELGVHVLRITAEDAYADGVPLYDNDTGAPITPAEHRRQDRNKDAWDRNYACKFVIGGTSACNLLHLDTAQRRGIDQCRYFEIRSDSDFDDALAWLRKNIGPGKVGLGWDLATTTKETSNPSSFSVMEKVGGEKILRAVFNWKLEDELIMLDRAERIIDAIAARPEGGSARRLLVDATNERLFARTVRRLLGSKVPVELVIASESANIVGEPMTRKQHLGGLLVAELDDNHLTLPPERYIRDDFRMVKKEKGQFVCEPDSTTGAHGDTFDSAKLSNFALESDAGAITDPSRIKFGQNFAAAVARVFVPRRLGGIPAPGLRRSLVSGSGKTRPGKAPRSSANSFFRLLRPKTAKSVSARFTAVFARLLKFPLSTRSNRSARSSSFHFLEVCP